MAAIRNLRNLVLSGIDDSHVQKVCQMITNEKMVAGSRLFPFRFYTAFDVLDDLENFSATHFKNDVKNYGKKFEKKKFQLRQKKKDIKGKQNEKLINKQKTMNDKAIEAFRKALDKAVKIATVKNIPPIKGVTIVVCSAGAEMQKPFGKFSAAKKSLDKSSQLVHASLLLGLMCQSCAEESQFWIYESSKAKLIPLKEPTQDGEASESKSLLGKVKKIYEDITGSGISFPDNSVFKAMLDASTTTPAPLIKLLRDQIWIDNIVWIHGSTQDFERSALDNWTTQYRQLINPDLLFVSVDVDGSGRRTEDDRLIRHPKDLRLSGFSEQIFLCLAKSGTQIEEVENIDKKYKLPISSSVTEDRALPDPKTENKIFGSLHWRQVRVFISSTFLDMHGERDLLNRFVFPELSRRCRKIFVDIVPIDLRWGIPNFGSGVDSRLGVVRQVRACIDEIDRCHFFVGFLGDRYGWKPDLSNIFDSDNFEAKSLAQKIRHVYKPGMSITELEMNYAALGLNPASKRDRVFFFLRDQTDLDKAVPAEFEHLFKSDSREDEFKLDRLKEKILRSGYEVSCSHLMKNNTLPQNCFEEGNNKQIPWEVVLAQMAERLLPIPEVCGLNPVIGTSYNKHFYC